MALNIYLAGPDVFVRDARGLGSGKKALCEEFGFYDLFPLDDEAASPHPPGEPMTGEFTAGTWN